MKEETIIALAKELARYGNNCGLASHENTFFKTYFEEVSKRFKPFIYKFATTWSNETLEKMKEYIPFEQLDEAEKVSGIDVTSAFVDENWKVTK